MKQPLKQLQQTVARWILGGLGSILIGLMLWGVSLVGEAALGSTMAMADSLPALEDIDLCTGPEHSLDLNNANLLAFTDCPGFYPTLASVILAHGPYQTVDDVLSVPNLTDYQQALLKANLKSFTATTPLTPPEQRMPPRLNQPAH